jgi:cobalt/nickel transport system permease protein
MSRNRWFLLAGLLVALFLAGVVSFYASSAPDGLEKVAGDKGIDARAEDHTVSGSPLADYGAKGVDDARLSRGVAGLAGVVLTFAAGGVLVLAIGRGRPTGGEPTGEPAGGPAGSRPSDAQD